MMQMASMQQSKAYLKARDLLAQNSALLALINNIPGEERDFDLNTAQNHYQLPIDRERELSEDLAFLAVRRKDRAKVMAVAIEEDQDKQGMTIRVAVNQGDLSEIKDGLNRIADIMQRSSARVETRKNLQSQLLQEIVTLDLSRILTRLKSQHGPSKSRKSLGKPTVHSLKQYVDDSIAASSGVENDSHKDLQTQCEVLMDVFDQFEALQSDKAKGPTGCQIISEILLRITQVVKFDIRSVLEIANPSDMSLIRSLPSKLDKLARYYKLSHSLIAAARDSRYTIFRSIRVLAVNANDFAKTSIILKDHPFDEVLDRFKTKKTSSEVVQRAREKSCNAWILTGKTTHAWRIHAEIQLLSLYQFQPIANFPRVLGASKKSCYLCCFFIQAHGRFQVPRTHGVLYSEWTLPDIPNGVDGELFLRLIRQLNQQLEVEVRKALVAPPEKKVQPNESVAALNQPWSSTSTMTALVPPNQGSTMPLTIASLSTMDRESSPATNGMSGSRSTVVSTNTFRARSHSPRAWSTPKKNEESNREPDSLDQMISSSSLDNIMCLDATPNWSCYRFSSPSKNIWCRYKGLNLYLSPGDDQDRTQDNGILHIFGANCEFWIGLKTIALASESQGDKLNNGLDVAHLDFSKHICHAGAAWSDAPLVLKWLDSALVLQFSVGSPPADPFGVV